MHEVRESRPENPEPIIPTGQPIPPDTLVSIPPGGIKEPKRPPRWLLPAVLGVFVLGGLAAAAVFVPPLLKKPAANVAATPTPVPTPGTVVYAVKQGAQTVVREWNVEAKASRQLFAFEEVRPYAEDKTQLYAQETPAVDYHPAIKQYAYMAKEGLFIRGLEGDPQRLLWATGSLNPQTKLTTYTYDPPLQASQPDVYGLYAPAWSQDGKHIGFLAGFYEGSQGIAMKVGDKAYTMTKDTVRSNGPASKLGERYTIFSSNAAYRTSGLLPDYQVKEYTAALGAQYSPDRSHLYAILCPKDLPATGNSKYVAAMAAEMAGQVDCGEAEAKQLVKIDLSSGAYTGSNVGTLLYSIQAYAAKLLVADSGKVYLPLAKTEDYKVAEYDPATSKDQKLNLLQAAGLTDTDDINNIIDVRVYDRAHPTAAVIHKNGDQIQVSLVELTTQRALGTFDLPTLSGFSVLGLR
jgi:hypothetical protein